MLRQARFQNFTRIPNATWEFSPGINVIVGENGLGKALDPHPLVVDSTSIPSSAPWQVL